MGQVLFNLKGKLLMNGHIKTIDSIKNMAVFQNFRWSSSVKDEEDNVVEFKKINILYGRNYSGKTTLARIIRAMETGSISDKYASPEFQLSFNGGSNITQNSLNGHGQIIRVFNEDFVKENLRFIVDDEHTINSFAILGEDNTKLEEEIEKHEAELGSEEKKSGLIGEKLAAEKKFNMAKKAHENKAAGLEKKLRDKANKAGTGIKHNKAFGDANYNVTKIKTDIITITADSYAQVSNSQVDKYYDLLKEEPKDEIKESDSFGLQYSTIVSNAQELVEKKIKASEPIQELLNDAALATWVRDGRAHHRNQRTKCAFCGSDLPDNLWEKLDKHFNKESEELRTAIAKTLASIKSEKQRVPNLLTIKSSGFYSNFTQDLEALSDKFAASSKAYCEALESVKTQLEKRENDIFTPLKYVAVTASLEQDLNAIRNSYEDLRKKSNEFTATLSTKQSGARAALRLHEVFTFITDINYANECDAIEELKDLMSDAETAKNTAKLEVDIKQAKISEIKAQLKDESKGADRVNDYLNNFFGHRSLSLKAIEETTDVASSGYRFEVTRNDLKAFNLSEGECSLIAFCYFMAKLEDVETKGNQPIIWIDDPISSLDANHIFFVYSLINAEIVTPEKYEENGEMKERERFKQLFISTHNLDFLKYLKRLPGANQDERKKESKKRFRYLILERLDRISTIRFMPKYLREYVTEFNYLFEQIHKCASIETIDDTNYTTFYNFGNNARKFLEIYLYYKYPNRGMTEETLRSFFGEGNIPAVLMSRINNEYSHLAGVFERGSTPTEVPEMKGASSFILKKIKEKDPDQYFALLQSIGVEEEPALELSAIAEEG